MHISLEYITKLDTLFKSKQYATTKERIKIQEEANAIVEKMELYGKHKGYCGRLNEGGWIVPAYTEIYGEIDTKRV